MKTVSNLERHLTDTDIANILSCPNATSANKMILDSLIMQMKCKEDLLDLCDQLEKIGVSPDMNNIIHDLRNGTYVLCIPYTGKYLMGEILANHAGKSYW